MKLENCQLVFLGKRTQASSLLKAGMKIGKYEIINTKEGCKTVNLANPHDFKRPNMEGFYSKFLCFFPERFHKQHNHE